MPDQYHLHGQREQKSGVALLLIDVINDMEFPGGEQLLKHALPAAHNIAELKARAATAGVPVIYVNDNFGRWRSDFKKQVRHCLEDDVPGAAVAHLLKPEENDYFVLKPKSSAFFGTTLHTLLQHLGVNTLVLTGVAADICILFTAHDAHLLDYKVVVPADCVASETARENRFALENMKKATQAVVCGSPEIRFTKRRLRIGGPRRKRRPDMRKKAS